MVFPQVEGAITFLSATADTVLNGIREIRQTSSVIAPRKGGAFSHTRDR